MILFSISWAYRPQVFINLTTYNRVINVDDNINNENYYDDDDDVHGIEDM